MGTLSWKAEVRERVGPGRRRPCGRRQAAAVILRHGQPPLSSRWIGTSSSKGFTTAPDLQADLPEGPVHPADKEFQYDYWARGDPYGLIRVTHERVTWTVPGEICPDAKDADEGGILDENLTSLKVECIV